VAEHVCGLYKGVVVSDDDPAARNRVTLRVPMLTGERITTWAEPCYSAAAVGVHPSPGDGVWVAYEAGDIDHPVWVGVFKTAASS
jgi:hypothetical protein